MKRLKNLLKPKNLLVGTAIAGSILFSNPSQVKAYSEEECKNNVAINGLFQGVVGGIGGAQNGESFWKSFYKSMAGGMIQGVGKCMVAQDLDKAWPAKLTNAVGTSISNNVAQGKGMLDSIGMDYGPLYVEWSKEKGLESYFLPESAAAMAWYNNEGYDFDTKKSLKYGTPYFTAEKIEQSPIAKLPDTTVGLTITNVVAAEKDVKEKTISHELIHTHQYSSSSPLGQVILKETGKGMPEWVYTPKVVGLVALATPQAFMEYRDRPLEKEAYDLTEEK